MFSPVLLMLSQAIGFINCNGPEIYCFSWKLDWDAVLCREKVQAGWIAKGRKRRCKQGEERHCHAGVEGGHD